MRYLYVRVPEKCEMRDILKKQWCVEPLAHNSGCDLVHAQRSRRFPEICIFDEFYARKVRGSGRWLSKLNENVPGGG